MSGHGLLATVPGSAPLNTITSVRQRERWREKGMQLPHPGLRDRTFRRTRKAPDPRCSRTSDRF